MCNSSTSTPIHNYCVSPPKAEGRTVQMSPKTRRIGQGKASCQVQSRIPDPRDIVESDGRAGVSVGFTFFFLFFFLFFLKKNYSLPTLTLQWKAGRQSASGFRSLDRPTAARGTVCALNVHVSTEQNGGGLFLLLVVVVPPPSFEVALAFHKWTNGLTGRERTHAPTHPHPPFPPRARDDGWGQRASGWI